jgi:hypothetical protein
VSAALAGLLGAIIGGGLTAGSNIGLEFLRHRRSLQADGKRDAGELRRAARLVADELAHSVSVIGMAAKEGAWDTADTTELKYQRWVSHQETLADRLPTENWFAVSGAYELLYLVARDTPEGELGEGGPAEFQRVIDVVNKGLAALNRYAKAE